MNILEELYTGKFSLPRQSAAYCHEVEDIDEELKQTRAELLATMSDAQIKLLRRVKTCLESKSGLEALSFFTYGYQLAPRLTIAALSGEGE